MALRTLDTNNALAESLLNNDSFIYAHLVKFEKPTVSDDIALEDLDGEDFSYITDAPRNVSFNDGKHGEQVYIANKLKKVGSFKEYSEVKAVNMSITVDGTALGTSISGLTQSSISNGVISGLLGTTDDLSEVWTPDFTKLGLKEGDIIICSSTNNFQYSLTRPNPSGTGTTTIIKRSFKARIDSFENRVSSAGNIGINGRIKVTFIPEHDEDTSAEIQTALTSAQGSITDISVSNPEIGALLVSRNSDNYASYINRQVDVFRVHLHPETGVIIGAPFKIFGGIVNKCDINEDLTKNTTVTWGLTSHWGDFIRAQGRLTSDSVHRAVGADGKPDLDAILREEYQNDFGFEHADKAVSLMAVYQRPEIRYENRKRGGVAGFFGDTKPVEVTVMEDREVDLRFDLQAKSLPVVYGVQKIESYPIFADLEATDSTAFYTVHALCEGEIGGLFDIIIDDKSSVCINEVDEGARGQTVFSSYNPQQGSSTSSGEIPCRGRADRGQVLGFDTDAHSTIIDSNINYYSVEHRTGTGVPVNPRSNGPESVVATGVPEVNAFTITPQIGNTTGVTHLKRFGMDTPITADMHFFAGRSNQVASSLLSQVAGNSNRLFKLQKNFYTSVNSNQTYWGPNHKLLDTAYIAAKFTIADGETTIPKLEFVVRGKYIDCYNYDGSFKTTENSSNLTTGGNHNNFKIGDTVRIRKANGDSIGSLSSGLKTVQITSAGTGFVNGTFGDGSDNNTGEAIPLTGGSGGGATATVVVSSNTVTSVTIVETGTGYSITDTDLGLLGYSGVVLKATLLNSNIDEGDFFQIADKFEILSRPGNADFTSSTFETVAQARYIFTRTTDGSLFTGAADSTIKTFKIEKTKVARKNLIGTIASGSLNTITLSTQYGTSIHSDIQVGSVLHHSIFPLNTTVTNKSSGSPVVLTLSANATAHGSFSFGITNVVSTAGSLNAAKDNADLHIGATVTATGDLKEALVTTNSQDTGSGELVLDVANTNRQGGNVGGFRQILNDIDAHSDTANILKNTIVKFTRATNNAQSQINVIGHKSFLGSFTAGSTTLTLTDESDEIEDDLRLFNYANVGVGSFLFHEEGIPVGTVVSSIAGNNRSLVMSQAATTSGTDATIITARSAYLQQQDWENSGGQTQNSENLNSLLASSVGLTPTGLNTTSNTLTFSNAHTAQAYMSAPLSGVEIRFANVVQVTATLFDEVSVGDTVFPRTSSDVPIFSDSENNQTTILSKFTSNARNYLVLNQGKWYDATRRTWKLPSGTKFLQGSTLVGEDRRTSTNPAIQLLDYLTNTRYGKGLNIQEDLDLESFKKAARDCDTGSEVTVVSSKPIINGTLRTITKDTSTNTLTLVVQFDSGGGANINIGQPLRLGGTNTDYIPNTINLENVIFNVTAISYAGTYGRQNITITPADDTTTTTINNFSDNTTVNSTRTAAYVQTQDGLSKIEVGHVYRYPETGDLQFQGTVKSVTINTLNGFKDQIVVFKDVIGKLGKEYKTWRSYAAGDLVWDQGAAFLLQSSLAPGSNSTRYADTTRDDLVTAATSSGTFHSTAVRSTIGGVSVPGYTVSSGELKSGIDLQIVLTRIKDAYGNIINSSGPTSNRDIRLQFGLATNPDNTIINYNYSLGFAYSTRDGNPFVKAKNTDNTYSKSGYSLYDADGVKYWKFCGWEQEPLQRWATRHQMNQIIQTDTPLYDNVNNMLKQFNGILRYTNGKYNLSIKQETPKNVNGEVQLDTITDSNSVIHTPGKVTDDDIIGNIKVTDKTKKDTYNSVNTSIVDPAARFGTRDISFFNSTYLKQDRGIRSSADAKIPGITNYFNARINVKQMLDSSRAGLKVSFKMAPKGALLLAGDFIQLTNTRFGFTDKLFRIQQLDIMPDALVNIIATEHDDSHYILDNITTNFIDVNEPVAAESTRPIQNINGPEITRITGGSGDTYIGAESGFNNVTHDNAELGTVTITLHHSTEFDAETMVAEIYRNETTNDFNDSSTIAIGVTIETEFVDTRANVGPNVTADKTIFYWVRYRRSTEAQDGTGRRVTNFSKIFPALTLGTDVQDRRGVIALSKPFVATNISYSSGTVTTLESLKPAEVGAENTTLAIDRGVTTTAGGIIIDTGGSIKSKDKDSHNDSTAGFFLGRAVIATQTATTTSGSTSVTLTAGNSGIVNGLPVSGTGIAAGTTVSSISGTSLGLSQNATASGSTTLSFSASAHTFGIGDSTKHLQWDGSDLAVTGTINANAGVFTNSVSIGNTGTTEGSLVISNKGKIHTTEKTTFADNDAGIFLGYDSNAYKLNIGNASDFIKWDGTTLSISGATLSAATIDSASAFAGSGVNFTALGDTPADFTGDAEKFVRVNKVGSTANGDALEFIAPADVRTAIGAGTSSFDGAFSSLSSKPTTIAGYGITDAFRTIEVDTDGNGSANETLGATETLRLKKGNNITLAEADGVVTITAASAGSGSIGSSEIADDSVTNAKLANMATLTIKGNKESSTGDPQDLTATEVRTLLNVADGATVGATTAQVTAIGLNTAKTSFPGFGTEAGKALEGDTALLQLGTSSTTALAGDTVVDGVADDAVTNTKLANMDTSRIKGRVTSNTGDPEDLTAAQVRTLLNVADGATANVGDITRVNITAGDGLTGSVDTASGDHTQTIAVGAGNLIDVQDDQVDVDLSELTDMTDTWDTDADEFVVLDSSVQKRKLSSEIFGSNAFNSTTIPAAANNATITIAQTGISDQTFTVNQSGDATITLADNNDNTTYDLSVIQTDSSNADPALRLAGTDSTNDDITITGGTAIDVTRNSATQLTVTHSDTSTQASSNNSGRTYIQDITLDTFGHVTGIETATETVTDSGTPAILSDGSTPTLNTGIDAGEVRGLINAGTSSLVVGTSASDAAAGDSLSVTNLNAIYASFGTMAAEVANIGTLKTDFLDADKVITRDLRVGPTTSVNSGSLVSGRTYTITDSGTGSSTTRFPGASSNDVGVVFTASGTGDGSGGGVARDHSTVALINGSTLTGSGAHLNSAGDFFVGVHDGARIFFDQSAGTMTVRGTLNASDINTGTLNASNITVSNLTAADITGDVSEHYTFGIGRGAGTISMDSLSSTKKTFDVDIVAPTGSVAKRPYIRGVAIVSTNNSSTDFLLEVRLGAGKSYTHTFTGYSGSATSSYGSNDVNFNKYSGNQIKNLALGGRWQYDGDNRDVYGFFYDSSVNQTFVLLNDEEGNLQNGNWALTPGTSTSSINNLCHPIFGAPSNGETHTVPFNIILPESTVATTFILTYSGSGYLRALHGEAGYLR